MVDYLNILKPKSIAKCVFLETNDSRRLCVNTFCVKCYDLKKVVLTFSNETTHYPENSIFQYDKKIVLVIRTYQALVHLLV